jgi:hypothetical protein
MHGSLTEPTVSYTRLLTQMRFVSRGFEEILEELPKLTADEKERLRQLLDYQLSWTEAEEQAIDEGIRPRQEGQSTPWDRARRTTPRQVLAEISLNLTFTDFRCPPPSRYHAARPELMLTNEGRKLITAANLVAASVGEDFIRHSELTEQVKEDRRKY